MLGIEARRRGSGEVDSLNVSVASALLCDAFLRECSLTGKSRMKVPDEQPGGLEVKQLRQDVDLTDAGQGEGDEPVADDRRLF